MKSIERYIKIYKEFPLPVFICDAHFYVYWSNSCAKRDYPALTRPEGICNVLEQFDLSALKREIHVNGCQTVGEALPFTGDKISLTPLLSDGAEGILAMVTGAGDTSPSHYKGKTAAMLSNSITRSVGNIFEASDSAYLKSVIMDGAAWLSPHLSRIGSNTYEILRVTRNITEFARYQTEIVIPKFKTEDLFVWLQNMSDTLISVGASVGVPVTVSVPGESLSLLLDIDGFTTAFCNIVHNSLFFTREGNSVEISAEVGAGEVILTVSDSGQGMTEEVLKNAFKPYFSTQNANGYVGAGVGLTLAKKIIEGHEGTIDIRSESGRGTRVAIMLPHRRFSRPLPLGQTDWDYRLDDKMASLYVGLLGITQFYYSEYNGDTD